MLLPLLLLLLLLWLWPRPARNRSVGQVSPSAHQPIFSWRSAVSAVSHSLCQLCQ
jgi:hypothetical protein